MKSSHRSQTHPVSAVLTGLVHPQNPLAQFTSLQLDRLDIILLSKLKSSSGLEKRREHEGREIMTKLKCLYLIEKSPS